MPSPGPILVYSKYTHDLPRFQQLLQPAMPGVDIYYAGSPAEAAPHFGKARILYGWGFTGDMLRQMPALRWVQKMGAGVDDIIGQWPFGPDVILTRTDGRLIATRMVEYVIAALLDKTARFDLARRRQAAKTWDYFEIGSIAEMTIGVAGLGEIGSDIAQALCGLKAKVVGWRRSSADTPFVEKLYVGDAQLGDFVGACDAIVLVLPMTKDTARLFNRDVFARFKPGAHLVNVGRGGVIAEDDLLSALDSARVRHATLDVFAVEPLPRDHVFWNHPNVTVTPHVCGPLVPEKVVPHFIENYGAFVQGRPLKNVIDVKRQY